MHLLLSAVPPLGTAHLEVVVGVLSAFTLLLMVMFVGVVVYSRRQKLLTPSTARTAANARTTPVDAKVTSKVTSWRKRESKRKNERGCTGERERKSI